MKLHHIGGMQQMCQIELLRATTSYFCLWKGNSISQLLHIANFSSSSLVCEAFTVCLRCTNQASLCLSASTLVGFRDRQPLGTPAPFNMEQVGPSILEALYKEASTRRHAAENIQARLARDAACHQAGNVYALVVCRLMCWQVRLLVGTPASCLLALL